MSCAFRAATDRCLNPLCAREKAQLFVDRKVANLAAKHPQVYRLQDGWLPADIPGALRSWQVAEVTRGARGAAPAVIANGPGPGRVKWVKDGARSDGQAIPLRKSRACGQRPAGRSSQGRKRGSVVFQGAGRGDGGDGGFRVLLWLEACPDQTV